MMTATKPVRPTISEVNTWDQAEFTRVLGPVFEHSSWVAERTWARRPFESRGSLHQQMCATVRSATELEQVSLIRAHPDLVGSAALAGSLTGESTREQASAGLDRLRPEEVRLFQEGNQAYRERFGFPFVICARLNRKEAIIEGFRVRLGHSREEEIETALAEISKIAYLRLEDIIRT